MNGVLTQGLFGNQSDNSDEEDDENDSEANRSLSDYHEDKIYDRNQDDNVKEYWGYDIKYIRFTHVD